MQNEKSLEDKLEERYYLSKFDVIYNDMQDNLAKYGISNVIMQYLAWNWDRKIEKYLKKIKIIVDYFENFQNEIAPDNARIKVPTLQVGVAADPHRLENAKNKCILEASWKCWSAYYMETTVEAKNLEEKCLKLETQITKADYNFIINETIKRNEINTKIDKELNNNNFDINAALDNLH